MNHLKRYNESLESSKRTRVLYIGCDDDFCASSFQMKFGGTPVSEIIDNIEDFKYKVEDPEEDYGGWTLKVYEFGEIDPKFVKFIKSKIQDYDDSKNKTFYLESDVI